MSDIETSNWSESAASNTAASPNGWPDGLPPSDVKLIDREMMGAIKRAWNRDHPTVTSGGSANAQTLGYTTNPAAYVKGQRYAFVAGFTNTGATTLAVGGLSALAVTKRGANALTGGEIIAGEVAIVEYDGTQLQLVSPGGAMSVANTIPAGVMMPYGGSSPPNGWLLCGGQAVSRTTFAALFSAIGSTFGSGDGSTTFNVPDLRGRAVAGLDNMGGNAASRITSGGSGIAGTTLGAAGGEQTHTLTQTEMPAHTHTVSTVVVGGGLGGGSQNGVGGVNTGSTGGGAAHNNVQPTIVLNYIIKT
jgi:microcystin-dependent protein